MTVYFVVVSVFVIVVLFFGLFLLRLKLFRCC